MVALSRPATWWVAFIAAVGQSYPAREHLPAKLSGPLLSLQLVGSAAGLLLVIGLIMVFSASSIPAALDHRSVWHTGIQQAIWAGVGVLAAGGALVTPMTVVRRWSGRCLLVIALVTQ